MPSVNGRWLPRRHGPSAIRRRDRSLLRRGIDDYRSIYDRPEGLSMVKTRDPHNPEVPVRLQATIHRCRAGCWIAFHR